MSDQEPGTGALGDKAPGNCRVEGSAAPADLEQLRWIEGQHLAVHDAVETMLWDRLGAECELVPDDRLEVIRHQPASQQVRVGERLPDLLHRTAHELVDFDGGHHSLPSSNSPSRRAWCCQNLS